MTSESYLSGDWLFYTLGVLFILLGVTFFLVPLLLGSGALSNAKIPTILLFVYNKGGFYFATSPILLIVSAIMVVIYFLRR